MSKTTVTIHGEAFHINGVPTYPGRRWRGHRIEGLLMNARMVQGIFDDRNLETRSRWAYPDTGRWDPERNTQEFIQAMPQWRRSGLLAFSINLQGGSPLDYAKPQEPWHNSAIEEDGSLRSDYLNRLVRILDKANDLGMAVILGLFYFGQDEHVWGEDAVIHAVDNTVHWLLECGYNNVLVELANECDSDRYQHPILSPTRVHEVIERVKRTTHGGRRLLVGTSYSGGVIPGENVVRASDFLLLHARGVSDPAGIRRMAEETRRIPAFHDRPLPIVFTEDDHYDFDQDDNNLLAAVSEHAGWGYFDPGENNYRDGYQRPPVNWGINTERKRAFFRLLSEITGPPVP